MKKPRLRRVAVNKDIVESSGMAFQELQSNMIELYSMLGSRARWFIPKEINDLSTIALIVQATNCLKRLRHCDGFDRHVANYTERQRESNFFVAKVAAHLVDKVDALVLEPSAQARSVKPDILVEHERCGTYFECKHLQLAKSTYLREHEQMFSVLSRYVEVPHQIDIRYKTPLSEEDVHRLGKELNSRTKLITGDGTIIHNSDLQVQVTQRTAFLPDRGVQFLMEMIVEDIRENCKYPGHAFARGGHTITISGPLVNYEKVLKQKLRGGRRQSPKDEAYVLAIDTNYMLGDLKENTRVLSTAFQPKINTRFSAVLLVESYWRVGQLKYDLGFEMISNPFAKFPIKEGLRRCFSSSRQR